MAWQDHSGHRDGIAVRQVAPRGLCFGVVLCAPRYHGLCSRGNTIVGRSLALCAIRPNPGLMHPWRHPKHPSHVIIHIVLSIVHLSLRYRLSIAPGFPQPSSSVYCLQKMLVNEARGFELSWDCGIVRRKKEFGPWAGEECNGSLREVSFCFAYIESPSRAGDGKKHTPKTATLLTTATFSEDVTAS